MHLEYFSEFFSFHFLYVYNYVAKYLLYELNDPATISALIFPLAYRATKRRKNSIWHVYYRVENARQCCINCVFLTNSR